MAEKGRELLRTVSPGAGRKDRGHTARDSRFRIRRAQRGEGQIRLQRQARHPDVRPSLSQQGHRSHDRCHACDPEKPRRCRVCRSRRDASQSRPGSGRGLSREPCRRACANSAVANQVVFLDQFVDRATLLGFISMCDVYVTPYLNEAQMTSGTLAYSFGLGKAIVSTPYWHARELLADGRGILVPFGDAMAIGREIVGLLTDDARRHAMCQRAYSSSRSMTWERTAERYLATFETARRGHRLKVIARLDQSMPARDNHAPPEMQIDHLLSMCDDTGLFQHAVHSVPDRSHGYCVDDNARALLLACALNNPGEQRMSEALTARLAAFVQHAWNPKTRAVSQLHELRSTSGLKTAARKIAMVGRFGPWASAPVAMPVRRGGGGLPLSSPKRCRPRRRFGRHAPGHSRCSDWTPIAPQLPKIHSPSVSGISLLTG